MASRYLAGGWRGCQVWVRANIPPILLVTQIIAVSPLFATSKPFPPFLPWFRISTQIINFFVVNNWKLPNIFDHFFIVAHCCTNYFCLRPSLGLCAEIRSDPKDISSFHQSSWQNHFAEKNIAPQSKSCQWHPDDFQVREDWKVKVLPNLFGHTAHSWLCSYILFDCLSSSLSLKLNCKFITWQKIPISTYSSQSNGW